MESSAVGAFLDSVMGRLFQMLEKEHDKQRGLEQDICSIQQDLRMVAAAMDDQLRAGATKRSTAVARLYREDMLDLTHDFEDCIDRFLHHRHRLTCCKQRSAGASSLLVQRL